MTYTIIQSVTNNYDKIYECYDALASRRILFTDTPQPYNTWEQMIITTTPECPWEDIFKYRWNPFDYTDTDYVIWVDGSIKITGTLLPYIKEMEKNNCTFATLQHPERNTIFDEYCAWIQYRNYPEIKAFRWMAFMEKNGWKPTNLGLYQVGVCIFKNDPAVKEFGSTVWGMLHLFDKTHAERLDQTIATYILKHEYAESIKVLPLTEMIYRCGPALCYHGVHPNR